MVLQAQKEHRKSAWNVLYKKAIIDDVPLWLAILQRSLWILKKVYRNGTGS